MHIYVKLGASDTLYMAWSLFKHYYIESHVAVAFDYFEVWTLCNTDTKAALPTRKGLTSHESQEEADLINDLDDLRKKLQNMS